MPKKDSQTDVPLRLADNPCNAFHLRRAARVVSRQYSSMMKDSGLQGTQFSVLYMLSTADSLSITDMARRMGLDRTSMSRNLIPLQEAKLIAVSEEDASRSRAISITPTGSKALQKALPKWRQAQASFVEHMGEADTALLIELLQRAARSGR